MKHTLTLLATLLLASIAHGGEPVPAAILARAKGQSAREATVCRRWLSVVFLR